MSQIIPPPSLSKRLQLKIPQLRLLRKVNLLKHNHLLLVIGPKHRRQYTRPVQINLRMYQLEVFQLGE